MGKKDVELIEHVFVLLRHIVAVETDELDFDEEKVQESSFWVMNAEKVAE